MEFIEEYHEELGTNIPIPELEMLAEENHEDFLVRNTLVISKAILAALTIMVEFNLQRVPCFAVKDGDMIFNLDRESAVVALDNCIANFTESEDYEMCQKLMDLKAKL